MSEQDTTAPETPDSPELAAPVEDSPQDDAPLVDWQKRATDNQAWATRLSQEKADLEARLAEYEESLQPDSPDDEYEEYDFEDSAARQQISALEQKVAQFEQAQAQAQEHAYIDSELDSIESQVGYELGEKVSNWIGRLAQELPRDQQGRPDVRAAYQEWADTLEQEKSKWVEGKPRGGKPASGPGAVEVPDLDDPDARADYIDRMMEG